jgi:hypothetical protein
VFWHFLHLIEWRETFQIYTEGMPKLKLLSFQLNCFVQNLFPDVDLYLQKRNI